MFLWREKWVENDCASIYMPGITYYLVLVPKIVSLILTHLLCNRRNATAREARAWDKLSLLISALQSMIVADVHDKVEVSSATGTA